MPFPEWPAVSLWLQPSVPHPAKTQQAVSDQEWKNIRKVVGGPEYIGSKWECSYCKKVRLGGRIATFSYRKSLDFLMFQKSWFQA